jgi:hypothetical protein
LLTSRQLRRRARPNLDFAPVDKIDRGIEDDLVAVFDAGAYLDAPTGVGISKHTSLAKHDGQQQLDIGAPAPKSAI